MAVLHFDKQELTNLEYSLQREMLSTNRAGGYMNTTIVCCNTRKYHGLMVCPNESQADQLYVMLSSLDETVVQHASEFNLAIHQFDGLFEPRGHKYIVDFDYTPTPTIIYRVGGVILRKELLWVHGGEQLLIRYTLVEAHSPTQLKLRPFLAFRNRHELSRRNMEADGRSFPIAGGVKSRLYDGFPYLHMQLSGESSFVAVPDWYCNIKYLWEELRGYEYREDLLTTGYFVLDMEVGKSVVFSASTTQQDPEELARIFDQEIARRSVKTEFMPALEHSARQFLIRRSNHDALMAGYPWYNSRSRETFIALAGCTLTQGLVDWCENILDYHLTRLNGGIFGEHLSADTQLWFFDTLSKLEQVTSAAHIWKKYSEAMKQILEAYAQGHTPGSVIMMHENGLVWASQTNRPLTWMNVMVDSVALTPRSGYAVEVNALWYNAICYSLKLAKECGDKEFVAKWEPIEQLVKCSFNEIFVVDGKKQLADYVYQGYQNTFVRPNQLMACSLDYSPISDHKKYEVLEVVKNHLLTTRGLRTLTPRNPLFKGNYYGDIYSRDEALHQGTCFVWLLEHYVRANFALHGDQFVGQAKELLEAFHEDMLSYGVGSIPELHDGNPPHLPGGAISYAPSVGALLSIDRMIKKYNK